ncbi:protein TASOR [Clarias magur]|uniref:Protein TASOR n=1 Tax=Clarias magur TaxID=1594786 RepID=A0A8J4XDQ4_CLAMG|nr:protein TASOR [Clarias magur]
MECHGGRAADRALARAGNPHELSRAANAPSQDGEPRSSECEEEEEPAAECRDAPSGKGSDTKRGSSYTAHRLAEEPPRLNFHIPRRNKEKRALFQYLSSESREFAEIHTIITSSYKDPASKGNFVYSKPRLIHNEPLEKEFIEKRKELKQDGRTDKELAETFCFQLSDKVPLVCEKGLSTGNSWMNFLGYSTKGVYLCQFSDLLQSSPIEPGFAGEIIIFKVIKGKVKSIHENMLKGLDPTPKFDSHFSKNANRVTSLTSYKAFEYTQQYFYEYVDFEPASRPRHVCPYAVVSFQFKPKEAVTSGPKASPLQRSNSMPSGTGRCGYTVWKGHFLNRGKEVYQASLHSVSQPFLPFKIPDRLEIGNVMRFDHVKQFIPSTLFSWDIYSGSHEVSKSGMHSSLFEVMAEKNKPGEEGLTELFHELERKGLVLVNMVNDKSFLFLLSSGQLSNSNERRSGWKTSCQALFIYPHARDVSKFSPEPRTPLTPLTPVPQDTVMPHLNSFLPAYHYALSKVRCNTPPNLSAGVEQQAHEYFNSLHESKPIQRVRLDYDVKLDDREKVFPAPRQRFHWEGYIRSYFFNPGLYTMPVQKAKNIIEKFGCVPESSTDPGTVDSSEDHGDPEGTNKDLKLLQTNKTKEAMLKEMRLDTHGLKRKLEEDAQNVSAKCSRMAAPSNGEAEDQAENSCTSLTDVLTSIGLQDTDLRKDKSQESLKLVELLDKLNQTTQDTDSRKDNTRAALVNKISRTLRSSFTTGADGKSSEDTEKTLQDSMTSLGLPTNCDTDLRNRFTDEEDQEARGNGKRDLEATTRYRGVKRQRQTVMDLRPELVKLDAELEALKQQLRVCEAAHVEEREALRSELQVCKEARADANAALADLQATHKGLVKTHSAVMAQLREAQKALTGCLSPTGHTANGDAATSTTGCHPELEFTPPTAELLESLMIQSRGRPDRLGCLLFRSVVPQAVYKEWASITNWDGSRGKCGVPMNLRRFLMSTVAQKFPTLTSGDKKQIKDRVNEFLRSPRTTNEETAGSLSSLEAFSPCSDSNTQQRTDNQPGERSIPWVLIPITGLKTERYSHRRDRNMEDPRFIQSPTVSTHTGPETQDAAPPHQADSSSNMEAEPEIDSVEDQDMTVSDEPIVRPDSQEQNRASVGWVDCMLGEQLSLFSSEVEDLLREEHVYYIPSSNSQTLQHPPQTPLVPFSEYISHFITPIPINNYVNSFRDSASAFLDHWRSRQDGATVVSPSAPEVLPVSSSPLINAPAYSPSSATAGQPTSAFHPPSPREDHQQHVQDVQSINGLKQAEMLESHRGETSDINSRITMDAGESTANSRATNNDATTPIEPAPAAISNIISRLQPEVITNLAQIIRDVQKNNHFYIHCVDENSDVCWEIKEYYTKLGQSECDPQTFLEKKDSQDKLQIVIQNVDIAAHIHTIPALVSLKKLPSVNFAGVDSVDDIKNNTYNELFVSGGFIVSDEFVLNPDFISQERLQALLHYLEELNTPESPWRWRVHCKTHKKVKEQSRCTDEARNILNLLKTYHKKQIVEFLSYHECDAPSHQAPDLDCLVKLQAQNIRQRHIIYLTERHFEMFPQYSNSGIVIASIDDILYSMASLIGDAGDKPASSDLHTGSTSPILREEDMGLSSEVYTERTSAHDKRSSVCTDLHPGPVTDPDSGIPDQPIRDKVTMDTSPSPTTGTPSELDFKALRDVISHFRNARMHASSCTGQSSPGSFSNTHQSFCRQSDGHSPVPQGRLDDDGHSNLAVSSFQASEGAAALQALSQMGEVGQREQIHAETVRASERAMSQDRVGSETRDDVAETASVIMEHPSNTHTDTEPTWNCTTDTDIAAEPLINPNISGTERDSNQEIKTSEQGVTKKLMSPTTSSSARSGANTVTSRNSRGGKHPVPGRSPYGMNTLVAMDRMLQSGSLWSAAPASQNSTIGLRSPLVNNSVANTFTHSGLQNLLPSSNMAWNSLAQGTVPNMWGLQPGLGQVHRTQFMQSYAWNGNPQFQGSGHPPPRGGYGGW